ncbi:MAG TPA: hypothetical protein VGC70_14040, partial [Burkholderiales bacterium]
MRAVLCKEFGLPESLAVEEVASPVPGPKDVKIAVRAAGVNFPDTLMIAGKYQVRPPLPSAVRIRHAVLRWIMAR